MGETTPQDPLTASSSRHASLRKTALAFLAAQSHTPSLPTAIDYALLRSLVSPHYTHTFGPRYAVSQAPKLQGTFTMEAFIEHLSGMVPRLETWGIEVRSVVVDEVAERVVVQAGYGMCVKGCEERVENEVVWWLDLEQEGEGEGGWRVRRSVEIVDPVAAGRVRELMMEGKDAGAVAEEGG